MFKTVPQKSFTCSIQGDFSKDNNMVLNCSPQVVCPPLNTPRTVLLDWYCLEGLSGGTKVSGF